MSCSAIGTQPLSMNWPNASPLAQQTSGVKAQIDPGDILDGRTMAAQGSQPSVALNQPGGDQQSIEELLNMLISKLSDLLNRDKPAPASSGNNGTGNGSGGGGSSGDGRSSASQEIGQRGSSNKSGTGNIGSMADSTDASNGPSGAIATSTPGLTQWNEEILAASSISGLAPNKIGAHIWAESRGRADTTTTNVDGTKDKGLIQMGQERWNRDVVPKLTAQERADIKRVTGKDAADLDVSKPLDNLIAGTLHIKQSIELKGGNQDAGTKYYNDGDVTGTGDIYLKRVNYYEQLLDSGKALSMADPF